MVRSLPANAGEQGFDPWSGKIPHVRGQWNPCAAAIEAHWPGAWTPQQEKPLQ